MFENRLPTFAAAATTTATTAAAAAESAAAAARTIFLGTRFIDVERPAVHIAAIEGCDGVVAFGVVAHFHKSKAARATSVAVGYQVYTVNGSVLLKHGTYGAFGSVEAEVSYENIFQRNSSF